MDDIQNHWAQSWRKIFQESRANFEVSPDFLSIVSAAKSRGFRRITLSEQMETGSADAYSWRGGVWVKE